VTDERLRALERRWRETGATDDEAQYLQARARAGELDAERLALLAHCGHPAAERIVGVTPFDDLRPWGDGLARWGKEVCVRAALAAALRVGARDGSIAVAEAWLTCPCEAHATAARAWVQQQWAGWTPAMVEQGRRSCLTRAATGCADAAGRATAEQAADVTGHALFDAAHALEAGASLAAQRGVRDAVRDALVPWLLA
jgi:hypothetical protein